MHRERQHAINVPLKDGMTDSAYEMLFKPIMRRIMEVYQPEAIVFQSGWCPSETYNHNMQYFGEARSQILIVQGSDLCARSLSG